MLKITGGEFRGRGLHAPADQGTRPSRSMLRSALFNSLQGYVEGAVVLDLFAGSGALGFEALSRGAAHVTFVESASAAIKCIHRNIETLKVEDRVRVIAEAVPAALSRAGDRPYDLILVDPPYKDGWEERLLAEADWTRLLAPEGRLSMEWSAQIGKTKGVLRTLPDQTPFLVKIREKNYGDSWLTLYARGPSCSEPSIPDPSTPSP